MSPAPQRSRVEKVIANHKPSAPSRKPQQVKPQAPPLKPHTPTFQGKEGDRL
ncbi:MAG: hypothetical protein ACFB4J_12820 [Elainellaceae cyanobacterium]